MAYSGGAARADHEVIIESVREGARVLDVGCGDGELLRQLIVRRRAICRGMELSQEGVNACVGRGLAVVQGDADRDLAVYPDGGFDTVILSKTIQAVRRPAAVLQELARIGRQVIVSFPNFGHWRVRASLALSGRMPMTPGLPAAWHESENIHLCTIRDFAELCAKLGLHVERAVPISGGAAGAPFSTSLWLANWTAEEAVFVLHGAGA